MQTVQIQIDGESISIEAGDPIVCGNTGNMAIINGGSPPGIVTLLIGYTYDRVDLTADMSDGAVPLPAFGSCFGVWITAEVTPLDGDPYTTGQAWLPCTDSITTLGTTEQAEYYDIYNVALDILNTRVSGIIEGLAEKLEELENQMWRASMMPSEGYRRALDASAPITRITGTITHDDETIEITDDSIATGTLTTEWNTMRTDALLPGGVPTTELHMTLRPGIFAAQIAGAEITLSHGVLTEDCVWDDVPLGVFTIASIGDDSAAGVPITAYDDMHKAGRLTIPELELTDKEYAPDEIARIIAEKIGVSFADDLAAEGFVNTQTHKQVWVALGVPDAFDWACIIDDADGMTESEIAEYIHDHYGSRITYKGTVPYKKSLPESPDMRDAYRVLYNGPTYRPALFPAAIETARDLLMHLCAIINGYAYIDRDRTLRIEPITKPELADILVGGNRMRRKQTARVEYRLAGITTVIDYPQESGTASEAFAYQSLWADGVTADLPTNALQTAVADGNPKSRITAQIKSIVHKLDPITYRPIKIDCYGDPSISPGDWMAAAESPSIIAPITHSVWRYRGSHTMEATGYEATTKSQAEKALQGGRIAASDNAYNFWRDIYASLMATYQGLNGFRYVKIEHFTYGEIEGGGTT